MKKKNKIIIISPIHPFRGGIAQYAEALSNGLGDKSDTSVISFKRLYPSFLYPGKADKVASIKDSPHPRTDYILDLLSPLSWLRAIRTVKKERPDFVVIAWWTFVWQPVLGLIALRLERSKIKVAFLCHNVVDHDAGRAKAYISKLCLNTASSFIVHTKSEQKKIHGIVKNPKILLRPHPIYTHFPRPTKKLKRKGRIELLYFGLIRPYKGVDTLIEAMSNFKNQDRHLTIVGEVWGSKNKAKLIDKINNSRANIEYNLSFVSDEEAANYFARADAVVMPYISATGSGVATLAYHYNKPIIATDTPGLNEAVSAETGWLIKPGSVSELASCISKLSKNELDKKLPAIKSYRKTNSWANMSEKIVEFLKDPIQ